MTPTARSDLAGYLSTVWLDLPRVDTDGEGPLGGGEPDLDTALALELRHLLADDERLLLEYERPTARPASELEQELRVRLLDAEDHHVSALQALLGGMTRRPRHTRRFRWVTRLVSWLYEGDGWTARKLVAVWMNVLVGLPVTVVVLADRSYPAWPMDAGDARTLLRAFAVWCLSFLPGWLYVRFLGQRAGALWNEFVLHLHRLGWDCPQFLPRPPRTSHFHEAWRKAGGPTQDHRHSIYRQKFDAFYGRAVAEGAQNTAFTVRTDSMFPVFLATAMLAVGWTTVLWEPEFLQVPTSSVWDVLRFAFLGAYAFNVQSLVRRFFQSDLRPSAYASAVLRLVFVLLTMSALHQALHGTDPYTEAAVAFVVGFFPVIALQALQRLVATFLRVFIQQITPDYPLNQLDGLNIWYEARLLEESIEDMQSLVTANMIDVLLHTRVPVGRLVDWVDQALLYLHLDRVERGVLEKWQVHRGRSAAVTHALGRLESSDPPPAQDRLDGSVNPALRAGSRTRVALRQLGIRTASELLVAFPPEELDAMAAGALPDGLDRDQVRMLVRVLDSDPNMAVIWNWRAGGPNVRKDALPSVRSRQPQCRGHVARLVGP